MKRLLVLALLLPLLAVLPPAAGRAQGGQPPGARADAGPAQTAYVCRQVLADPEVSATPSPWQGYASGWSLSTARSYSPPQSILLSSSGAMVGQVITVTASLAELYGSLSYYYTAGSVAQNDQLRVRLHEVGNNNTLGNLITTTAVLTSSGRVEGSWQTLDWEVSDPATISQLAGLANGRAALAFSSVSAASPGTQQLWLDDLTASTCVQGASLGGRVTQGAAGLGGAPVLLAHTSAGVTRVAASTRTEPDGTYRFPSVSTLSPGESYRLWFVNQAPGASGLLGFWAGPRIDALGAGQALTNLDLNVAGVTLLAPASHAEVVASDAAPVELRWRGRSAAGERHRACIYDPERADPGTGLPLTYCSPAIEPRPDQDVTFALTPGSLPASFGFTYGRSYRWYVEVYDRDPSASGAQHGHSFAERAITLARLPHHLPPEPMTPQDGEPAAGVPDADWTLLIYVAADNAIGDPDRAPNLGRPVGQLASLEELAAAHPRVNLVSYVDVYEPDGVEVCAYPPGLAPDCRVRAEANTADPSTLARFISDGRERFPARHTALLIVSPGQAAGSLALDEMAPGGPAMSLAGLDAAYQAAGLAAAKLDLVIYQAPLLGSVEVMRATAPYARYMVASAGQVWQLGPYRQLVPALGGPSRFDVAAVAQATVTAYATTVGVVGGGRATTWAAYDLGRAAALGQAVDSFAEELEVWLSLEENVMRPALAAARAAAQSYDSSGNGLLDALETSGGPVGAEEDSLVDLRDLAAQLGGAAGVPAAVQQAATSLIALLDAPATSPVIASAIRSGQSIAAEPIDLSRARGLAAFFPGGDRLGGGQTLAESYHGADPPSVGAWATMLRAYQAGVLAVGPGGVTQSAGGEAQLRPLPGGFVSTTLYLPVVRQRP